MIKQGDTLRFVLYTQKTPAQCMSAINERLQLPPSKSRPDLSGWVEKGGRFTLSVTARVIGPLGRTTRLTGTAEREAGATVIKGYVPDGVSPQWQRILLLVLIAAVALLLVSGNLVLSVVALVFGSLSYIFMMGDYKNSEYLLIEIERLLKATPKPAKRPEATRKK